MADVISFTEFTGRDNDPTRRKRVGATTDSIALIASNNGDGCILACDGPGIEADNEALSSWRLDDRGLDNAPDGLSIWEGYLHCCEINTPDAHEYETSLEGTFRELTDEEWTRYRETDRPWLFEDEVPGEPSHET